MGGLGPADAAGNYTRPSSDPLTQPALNHEDLLQRSAGQRPILVIGRSCPWAHRTWLVHQLRHLHNSLTLVMARADHNAGRWALDPALEGCKTLLELYQHCDAPPSYRATVPVLVDPKTRTLLGNDSAPLVDLLNRWPHQDAVVDLAPAEATDRSRPGSSGCNRPSTMGCTAAVSPATKRPTTALKPISSLPLLRWSRASKPMVHGCAAQH